MLHSVLETGAEVILGGTVALHTALPTAAGFKTSAWGHDKRTRMLAELRALLASTPLDVKNASILRVQPNIKWGIDRGTNPDGSKRDNDVRLTIAQKQAARENLT